MSTHSLYYLATKACIKNIRSITDIGDIPYELIRPVLLKLQNPAQLHELEKASPQLYEHDAEIWREFIKRDIPEWKSKLVEPLNPEKWYSVYKKLLAENERSVDADAEILKAALDGIREERAKHTSKIVDPRTVPRLPLMSGMRPEGGRAKASSNKGGNPAILTFASGSKTKTLTGKGVMDKARREARELSLFSTRKSVLAIPTHRLTSKATTIRAAPQALVENHRRPAPLYVDVPKTAPPTTIFAPRRRSTPGIPASTSMEERERRLRALTSGKAASTQAASPSTPRVGMTSSPRSAVATIPAISTSILAINGKPTTPSIAPISSTKTDSSSIPTIYHAPRPKPTANPDVRSVRPVGAGKTKAQVDIFMPTKRRKIA